jgi:hypothetical protein
MKLVYFMVVLPLFVAVTTGCGGGDSKIIAPSEVVSPSNEEIETEEYEKAMLKEVPN